MSAPKVSREEKLPICQKKRDGFKTSQLVAYFRYSKSTVSGILRVNLHLPADKVQPSKKSTGCPLKIGRSSQQIMKLAFLNRTAV